MALSYLGERVCLTDGGMETTLIFHEGLELPEFAAFTLLASTEGQDALRRYYDAYLDVAEQHGLPILLDTPTWRASSDWGERLGYTGEQLVQVNREAVAFVRAAAARRGVSAVVSGAIGPRADGYVVGERMTAEEAEKYHTPQLAALADAGVDLVSALTLTYVEEAIGIARAAAAVGVSVAISFTVETDGSLPSGQPLGDALVEVDRATDSTPAYYMVNCAHPTHFAHALGFGYPFDRLRGVRVNASAKSHAELDEADELDAGDPNELAAEVAALRGRLARLTVVGGCCGTDHRHIAALAHAVT